MRCFVYNNVIVFAVPSDMISKAIGIDGRNVRFIQQRLEKKIKIVREPSGIEDIGRFIQDVIEPISFRSVEINGNEVIINAGSRNKASLIGRDKIRWQELSQIVEDIFGKSVRII